MPSEEPTELKEEDVFFFLKNSLLHLLLPHIQSLIGLLAFGESIPVL